MRGKVIRMKRIKIIGILIIFLLIVTGCSSDTTTNKDSSSENSSDTISSANKDIDTSGSGKLLCTREASAAEGIDVDLKYEIQYNNGIIQILHSIEKIVSENKDSLDEYEEAYRKIASNYEGLKYYDTSIVRTDTTVTNDTTINYEKLDMNKLIEIEGEEDNVVEDGRVKLATWLDFAEKFGTTCEEATE